MLIPVLIVAFVVGLVVPARAWWSVPLAAVVWPLLFPPGSGGGRWIADVLAGMLLGALNAAVGVALGVAVRRRLAVFRDHAQ